MKIDDQTLFEFSKLKAGHLHKFLKKLEQDIVDSDRYTKEELQLRWNQGQRQILAELIDCIEKGEEILKKREVQKKHGN